MSLADLADLAGVSRPAVSNWRRRNDDFPLPVQESGATSLFRLAELQAWMRWHNKKLPAPSAEQAAWSALNQMRGQVLPEEAAAAGMMLLGYLAVASQLGEDQRTVLCDAVRGYRHDLIDLLDRLNREAWRPGLEDVLGREVELPWWWDQHRSFFVKIIELAAAFGIGEVFDGFVAAAARGSRGGGHATPPGVADLMVRLAAPIGGVIFDPACGHGTLLLAAARKAKSPFTLVGQEISPAAGRIARLRMFVHGLDANVLVGDTLRGDDFDQVTGVDLVLADPPFGVPWRPGESRLSQTLRFGIPPASRPELVWLQDGIARLRPGGLAIFAFPAGPLFRGGAERDIRCRLIESQAIRAIVALPPSLYPSTGIPVALWIVGRPGENDNDQILLIDASASGEGGRTRGELPPANILSIEKCYRSWRAGRGISSAGGIRAAAVSISVILQGDGILDPGRWVHEAAQNPNRQLERIGRAVDGLAAAEKALPVSPVLASLNLASVNAGNHQQTFRLDEVAEIIRPPRIEADAAATGSTPWIRPADVGLDAVVTASRGIDTEKLAGPVTLTRPGDIIVLPEGSKPRAAVDHSGDAVVGAPLQIVRSRNNFLPPVVLAELITLYAPRYALGSVVKRISLPALELPCPSAGAAHVLAEILDVLSVRRRQAAIALKAIDELRENLVEGICTGTLGFHSNLSGREES